MMMIRCLMFDLDGTLIDSRRDLANSVNFTLQEFGLPILPVETVADFIGEGIVNLIKLSLTASLKNNPTNALIADAVERFHGFYDQHLLDNTTLYPQVAEILAELTEYKKVLITNKAQIFSEKILDGLGIRQHFDLVLGGGSLPEQKPSPLPLLIAAGRLNFSPSECLMIGDSRIDVEAGRAANIKTCGLASGFRGRAELAQAGVGILLENFADLREVLRLKVTEQSGNY